MWPFKPTRKYKICFIKMSAKKTSTGKRFTENRAELMVNADIN